ncbi:hypothetical protein GCM10010129_25720 [Streptomyces fumigatiscleroticus]|nr:hypothetical protein GCM10010129_25720 [Streptomyces fumigatiscleroticus]
MSRPRILVVGAGFAGYRTARTLSRLTRHRADITVLNPTDYFLYLPLLPQVAAGILEPRRVTVSLTGTLPHVRLVLGEAERIDLDGRTVRYSGPEGEDGTLGYDRLVLAAGSVNKLLPVPGVAEHAHGFRGLPEALYLRDHVTRQMELAAGADDARACAARCTFVVVGAGYTGTEVAAHGQLFTEEQVRARPLRAGVRPRWMLLDIAPRVLPELDERLSRTADRVLRRRGVEVRMGTSVREATHEGVLLTDGEFVRTRTLVWCVGVRPDPLVESLGLPLERGRLLVDAHLQVPGRPELFACGDVAAVPDLYKPGSYTPMTAQHAWRQGSVAARNVAASLGIGGRRAYRHRDLGFVVDLGGVRAAANPLGVPLSGPAAGAVTRGYHLAAMPGNRVRVAADWLLDAVLPRQSVQLGLVRSWSVPLDTASPELARVPGGPKSLGTTQTEDGGPEGRAAARAEDGGPEGRAAARAEDGGPEGRAAAQAEDGGPEARAAAQAEDGGPEARAAAQAEDGPGETGTGGRPSGAGTTGGEAQLRPGEAGPGSSRPGGEPVRVRPSGESAQAGQSGTPAQAGQSGTPAQAGQSGEPAQVRPGGEPGEGQPGGEPAKGQPGGEPAKGQPGGEPAKGQPGGEPAKGQPGGEPAKGRPSDGSAASHAGGEATASQPGHGSRRKEPGGGAGEKESGENQSGAGDSGGREHGGKEPGGKEPGGKEPDGTAGRSRPGSRGRPAPAKKQRGGKSAKSQAGRGPGKARPGGASAEPQPGGDAPSPGPPTGTPALKPSVEQPSPGPEVAPGPVERGDESSAEGDS